MANPAETLPEKTYYTVQEYFVREDAAEYRSEYVAGKIVAMAGGTVAHDHICKNIYALLHQSLRGKGCDYFTSNVKLGITAKQKYYYPDAMVICGELQFFSDRTDTLENPTILFEVLSPGTERVDRGEKFHDYWSLKSTQEYVLLAQDSIQVEVFRRKDEKTYQLSVYKGLDDTLLLESLSLRFSLAELYDKVTFPA